jgi:hypothetical protein
MSKTEKKRVVYGHIDHRSGSGKHDNRPKRERTREKSKKKWEKEYEVSTS